MIAAAALEKALQVELARLLYEEHAAVPNPQLGSDLSRSDTLTAGQLLKKLRDLDLPTDLDRRIGDAIDHRNRLVHHTFEDPQIARAVSTDQGFDHVVARIDQFATDCAALTVELQLVAVPGLDLVNSIDPSTVSDSSERTRLEAIQEVGRLDGLVDVLDDLTRDK